MIENKQKMREGLIAARLAIPSEVANAAAEAVAEYLLEIIPNGASVAGYCAMRGEINVNQAIDGLQNRGNVVALPVIAEGEKILKFFDCLSNTPLIAGKYGIPCPQPHLPEIIPNIVIVPLVGFDASGNRLGYGGGYYDATIHSLRAANKQVRIIGVAYNMQKSDNIPTEPHDEKMDMVVTEKEIIRCV